MMVLRILLVAIFGFATALRGVATPPSKGIEGEWIAVSAQRNGKAAKEIVGHRLLFKGKNFSIRKPGGMLIYGGTFRVDGDKKPAVIVFKQTKGLQKGKTWNGIYRMTDKSLTICDNGADTSKKPPAQLRSTPGSGHVLVVFRLKQ